MIDHGLNHIHDEEIEDRRRSTVYMIGGLAVILIVLSALVFAIHSISISIG